MIYQLDDRRVRAEGEYWVADCATLIGAVLLKHEASVWFNAVLRGDNELITVGEGSNVQECAVLHTDPGCPLVIGRKVTVGHQVTLHGCTVGDNTLIGINAVVLNGARIGRNCLIGANALVPEGKDIPDNSLVVGSPGKVARVLTEDQIAGLTRSADGYIARWRRYRAGLAVQPAIDPA
ncbi:MAG: gamma carbonic anhydrase family protein [Gammaproteobacteria bacterium]|nr:gamma carbonic anhydrase family protein [Gammaproteobacteria bacterium]